MICKHCKKWRESDRGRCVDGMIHEDHLSECGVIQYPDVYCTCSDDSPEI